MRSAAETKQMPAFVEKLLDGADVEWVELGALVQTVTAPAKLKRNQYQEHGTTPIVDQGVDYIAGFADAEEKALPPNEYIVFGDHSEHIKYVDFSFVQGADGLKILRQEGNNTKFLYHAFKNFYKKQSSYKRHWSSAKVTLIPIPCPDNPKNSLAIQAEIVRILDRFTELTTELTAELAARKKQYNYYRDRLFSFEEGEVEWKPLGELGEFIRGKRFTKADYVDNGIDAIHYGEIYTHYGVSASTALSNVRREMASSLRYANSGDVVMAGVSETVEDVGKAVAWLGTREVAIHDDSYAFRHSLNPKFVVYYMQTARFNAEKVKHVSKGKIKRLLIDGISKVCIPVPYSNSERKSRAEQARIVAILDKFDTLTHSISEGLPREIELRQQQHKYYRDLLLSFPKPTNRTEAVT